MGEGEKMKKEKVKEFFLVVIFLIAFAVLVNFIFFKGMEETEEKNKEWEREYASLKRQLGNIVPNAQEIVYPEKEVVPSGTYILLTNREEDDLYYLSFYKDGEKICQWDNPIVNPYSFKDLGTIYISQQNCKGMGIETVVWDLSKKQAFLENGDEVQIWTLSDTQFFSLN